ncbi:transposase [Streptomyces sp. CB02980]|nr:transposase [Streptomyces sp. CB02980]MCB8908340.1 transposase [Streptomyces sp. CB02980]
MTALGALGYNFSPRFRDLDDQRFWWATMPGVESGTYGVVEDLARNRVNLNKVITHWPDMLKDAGSLVTNQVRAYDLGAAFADARPPGDGARSVCTEPGHATSDVVVRLRALETFGLSGETAQVLCLGLAGVRPAAFLIQRNAHLPAVPVRGCLLRWSADGAGHRAHRNCGNDPNTCQEASASSARFLPSHHLPHPSDPSFSRSTYTLRIPLP